MVTAGAWLGSLLGSAAGLPPLKVTLEQVQHFAPIDPEPEWPSFIHYRGDELAVYGLRTPGEGVKVDEHHAGRVDDPNDDDRSIDLGRVAGVRDYVERWFPGLDPQPVNTSTCLYTTTPNEDFVIDRVGPIVVGSPCSGHGFKFVPLIGRMLADLADGTETVADPRFALRTIVSDGRRPLLRQARMVLWCPRMAGRPGGPVLGHEEDTNGSVVPENGGAAGRTRSWA